MLCLFIQCNNTHTGTNSLLLVCLFVCFYHQGRTALEAAIQTLNIDKADDELSTGRQQVVKLLRNHKATKISSELRRRNVVFGDDDNDEEADESSQESTSALQRFNDKLMKKEIERLQRMNKKILEIGRASCRERV